MDNDWATHEYLANISAEELARALDLNGIRAHNVGADEDGVTVHLAGIRDAEALMTLTQESTQQTGTMYDRATGSCLSLSALDDNAPHGDVANVIDAGWVWVIHPHMSGRVTGWHVSVTFPVSDADQMTARLNDQKRGYPV